jgi:uncharacterized damage-inducible protein DinB
LDPAFGAAHLKVRPTGCIFEVMSTPSAPEVWLRGPIEGIPALLQPVAHALLQCREEWRASLPGLTQDQIMMRPAGAASIAFHVQHATGSLDRLFTYARGERLSAEQKAAFLAEADPAARTGREFLALFEAGLDKALAELRSIDEATLTEPRFVGRAQLPSTRLGLIFHAAEHTQRHAGQVATTIKVVTAVREPEQQAAR